jgi:glycosyltransferase involved in cell wall biosynthesis
VSRVSFVVPTRNAARTLRACLASICRQRDADVELIVVDNASDDETFAIANDFADIVLQHGPERSAQRNLGAKSATGSIVVFVDADMVLPQDVARDCVALLGPGSDPSVRAVVLPELAFGSGYLAKCRALEKELYFGDLSVEAARAFRIEEFLEAGGYDESLTGPEDWELADRIVGEGGVPVRAGGTVWHDEGRIELRRAFEKKRYYGRGLAEYVRTNKCMDHRRPGRRYAFHRRGLRVSISHPSRALGLAVLKTVEFSGAAVGAAEALLSKESR